MYKYKLKKPGGATGSLREEIQTIQLRGGLNITGVLDDATKKLLLTPRCGVYEKEDENQTIGQTRRKKRFYLQGTLWEKRVRPRVWFNDVDFFSFQSLTIQLNSPYLLWIRTLERSNETPGTRVKTGAERKTTVRLARFAQKSQVDSSSHEKPICSLVALPTDSNHDLLVTSLDLGTYCHIYAI